MIIISSFHNLYKLYPRVYDYFPILHERWVKFGGTIYIDCINSVMDDPDRGSNLLNSVLRGTNHGEIYDTCIDEDLDPNEIADEIVAVADFINHYDEYIANDVKQYLVE